MKVYVASSPNVPIICVAKTYKAAVNHLFRFNWINVKDELMIDDEMTTLEKYFGEDCVGMMAVAWDEDMFNEFWDTNFWIHTYEMIE
jgi:hypothetical protein